MPNIDIQIELKDYGLTNAIGMVPEKLNQRITRYMHSMAPKVESRVRSRLPRYPGNHTWFYGGSHAKDNPSSTKKGNLNMGFYVRTNGTRTIKKWREYGYLVFPEEGRGEKNKKAHKFFERTKEEYEPIIVQNVNNIIKRTLKEV